MAVPTLREVMQFATLTPALAGVALGLVGAQWVALRVVRQSPAAAQRAIATPGQKL